MLDRKGSRVRHPITIALVAASLGLGCATGRIENEPLAQFEPGAGYGATLREVPNGNKLRVVLAFSGGGTRAAALSYGVLEELRKTEVVIGGKKLRLLDQISFISSVSGGSFTSMYYGLKGEGIFDDFEERFLRRNINAHLAIGLFRPIKMLRMLFTRYSRSDMAMDIYDKYVFEGATFEDLASKPGPIININSTDLDVSSVFTFIQPDFNLICSDLSKLPVSRAVTASSAVPGMFAPLMLQNFAGGCGAPEPKWIEEGLAHPREDRRKHHEARTAATYLDKKQRPYIFLVDGGVADNIGARRIMADISHSGGVWELVQKTDLPVPEHVLYIIVNAQAGGKHGWDKKPRTPSMGAVLSSISGTGIYRYNFETIELLRETVDVWSRDAAKHGAKVRHGVVEVAFDNLPDAKERKYFNDVATSFNLDDPTIDRLIEAGGRLLRDSPDFKDFLATLK